MKNRSEDKPEAKTLTAPKRIRKPRDRNGQAAKSAVSATTPTVETPCAPEYPIFDQEAAAWVYRGSIAGAYAPVLYIGEMIAHGISQMLGRSLTLAEAQHLVSPDGEPAFCYSEREKKDEDKKLFQPVKYLPFIPKNLEQRLKDGEEFTSIDLPWGGAYYVTRDNEIVAFSGAVFHYDRHKRHYGWHARSPLVRMARKMLETKNGLDKPDWGKPLQDVKNIQVSRAAIAAEDATFGAIANDLLANRQSNRRHGGHRDDNGARRRDNRMERAQMTEAFEKVKGRRNNHAVTVE
jgi:hypothetical protein